MSHHRLTALIYAVLASSPLLACSEQSLIGPGAALDGTVDPSLRLAAVPGSYALDFSMSGPELILTAHVEDHLGNPAEGGVVTFQYCSLKGRPRNDISQPDEAPISACADGSARWVTLGRIGIEEPIDPQQSPTGNASLNFGVVQVVNIIGFRYRYDGQRSGIADATSAPEDWIR